jgi:beta-lactamase class D OXA-29
MKILILQKMKIRSLANISKIILLLNIILFTNIAHANEKKCFIVQENNKYLIEEGECNTRYAPNSTFKIALSLIGYDSGILKTESYPSWSLPDGVDPYINVCKGEHNPRTWMRDSCLWYSRILTNTLGIEQFQNYVSEFSYGNTDLSGGLTDAWISSSLKISPKEQIIFLQKLVNRKLPISDISYDKTKIIMFIQEMAGGWKLYGKTGNGRQFDKDGNKTDLQDGWFVGYIEKGNRKIVFASHIVDNEKQDTFASFRVRNEALIKLWHLIDELEK